MSKPNLPAIIKELGIAVKVDNFNSILNQAPPKQWIKLNKGIEYQPISRVKNSLMTIFQDYDWAIKDVRIVANSILVYGTLTVINPITGRASSKDGVGAVPVQLKSGSKTMDIENIIHDAIQKNAPSAESFAFKNAAAKFGKLFSNGKSEVDFEPVFSREVPIEEIKAAQQ
jgi:hypothetical protein